MTQGRDGWRWVVLGPGLASALVVLLVGPAAIVTPGIPTGVDLGGHIYPIADWMENWLSRGRVHGWSPGWFGGFPLYYFYFPLPAFFVVVAATALPLAIALKVVAVLGSVALPWALWYVLRSGGLSGRSAAVATLVASTVLLMESHWHLGGNLYSTLVGEFSFAWSLFFCVLYVGVLTRTLTDGVPRPRVASACLAAAALSHVIPTFVAVVAAAVSAGFARTLRSTVATSWIVGFMLAAFWAVPFLVRAPFLAETEWALPPWSRGVIPLEILLILPVAALGAVVVGRAGRRWIPLLAFTLVGPLLTFLPGLPMGNRVLSPYYVGVHLLTGIGLAWLLTRVGKNGAPWARPGAVAATALIVGLMALRGPGTVRAYATEVLGGYPAAPGAAEFQELLRDLDALPPGRVLWQSDSVATRFGRSFALDVLPYLDPEHPTLPGLLRESSITEPFVGIVFRETSPEPSLRFHTLNDRYPFDFDRGVRHMDLLGVRYFVAFTDPVRLAADAHPDLVRVVDAGGYAIYELAGVELVEPARRPVTAVDPAGFRQAARTWFEQSEALDSWVVGGNVATATSPARAGGAPVVTAYETGPGFVRFQTTAVGVPHLVKTSYFPNWRAQGATGPFPAAASYMVVVPVQGTVELRFGATWVERVGWLLTFLGALVLVAWPRLAPWAGPAREPSDSRGLEP